jgi:hypothetical protein
MIKIEPHKTMLQHKVTGTTGIALRAPYSQKRNGGALTIEYVDVHLRTPKGTWTTRTWRTDQIQRPKQGAQCPITTN